MKFQRLGFFCLFAIACSTTTFAHENKYIFVGQKSDDGLTKIAFVLEVMGDDIENYAQINETGEVYLKVDKIIAVPVPKSSFSDEFMNTQTVPYSTENVINAFLLKEDVISGNRVSPEPKKWQCPYCNRWWILGEECKNSECATNQWKKKKEEGS